MSSVRPIDQEFEFVTEGRIDERKRISLAKVLGEVKTRLTDLADEALHFRLYINAAGQILLDPTISVPAREVWLYRDPELLAGFRRSVEQAERGELVDLDSFAKFADDKLED
jgi:hypothetical protein